MTLGNADGESGPDHFGSPTQAELQALRDKCEELADDVRALSLAAAVARRYHVQAHCMKSVSKAPKAKGRNSVRGFEGAYIQVGTANRVVFKDGEFQWGTPHFSGTYSAVRQDKFSCIVGLWFRAANLRTEYRLTRRGQTYTLTDPSSGETTKLKRQDGKSFLAELPRTTRQKPSAPTRAEQPPAWRQLDDSTAAVSFFLSAESVIRAAMIPVRPSSRTPTVIRVTHSSEYGRVDSDVFVRLGDPERPLGVRDFDTVSDWRRAKLIEDLLWNDERQEWMLRAKAKGKTSVWSGTYEVEMNFPKGHHQVELKIISRAEAVPSVVLSNWRVYVR